MSEIGKKLMNLLKEIYDDHDFVCGTMSNCGEEGWEKMCEYITFARENGKIVTSDEVLALSLVLGNGEKNKNGVFSANSPTVAMI